MVISLACPFLVLAVLLVSPVVPAPQTSADSLTITGAPPTSANPLVKSCPKGWNPFKTTAGAEICFFELNADTYPKAVNFCAKQNATVLEIKSEEENSFFGNRSNQEYWISNQVRVDFTSPDHELFLNKLKRGSRTHLDCKKCDCQLYLTGGVWDIAECTSKKAIICTGNLTDVYLNSPVGETNIYVKSTPPTPPSLGEFHVEHEDEQQPWVTTILVIVFGLVAVFIIGFFLRSKCGNSNTSLDI